MKKLVLVIVAMLYTTPSYSFFGWNKSSVDTPGFKTRAAQQAYNDCMNGASGDAALSGCKSKECRRICKRIGEVTDQAKAEGVYSHFSKCVFDRNRRNDKGYWLPRGCQIRDKRCWNQCLAWAQEKQRSHTSVQDVKKSVRKPLLSSMSICANPWFSCRESQ